MRTLRRTAGALTAAAAAALMLAGCASAAANASTLPDAPAPAAASTVTDASARSVSAHGWRVTIGDIEWDQTARILAEASSPITIPDGNGYALVFVTMQNTTHRAATPDHVTVELRAGSAHVGSTVVRAGDTRMPAQFDVRPLQPGKWESGNLGYYVPDSMATSPDCSLAVTIPSRAADGTAATFTLPCTSAIATTGKRRP